MFILAVLLWVCIRLAAPAWCYWLIGISAFAHTVKCAREWF